MHNVKTRFVKSRNGVQAQIPSWGLETSKLPVPQSLTPDTNVAPGPGLGSSCPSSSSSLYLSKAEVGTGISTKSSSVRIHLHDALPPPRGDYLSESTHTCMSGNNASSSSSLWTNKTKIRTCEKISQNSIYGNVPDIDDCFLADLGPKKKSNLKARRFPRDKLAPLWMSPLDPVTLGVCWRGASANRGR